MTNADAWATQSQLPLLVDALGMQETDEPVQRLIQVLGAGSVRVTENMVGVPALPVRKLRFRFGGEIVLHHGVVVGAILHLRPGHHLDCVVDLSDWIEGTSNDATLNELETALGCKARFSGSRSPYFAIGTAFAQLRFTHHANTGGWNEPGNLARVIVTRHKPGTGLAPDADECPTCSALAAIDGKGDLDLDATMACLKAAVIAKTITPDSTWVRLDDLLALHASGQMNLAESQLSCQTCRRVICLTLYRNGAPTFGYYTFNEARRRPMEPIPPVTRWGDEERVIAESRAMQYVDHQPSSWFLVQQGTTLYLDARYSYGAVIDDSALIELNDEERESYRLDGRQYLDELAERIHMSAPYREDTPYYARNLFRRGGDPGRDYRSEVSAAIVNHTWAAGQREGA